MPRPATKLQALPNATPQDRALLAQLNKLFQELRGDVDALIERPSFRGDVNMGGFRITNVGASLKQGDVPNRKELEDKALFENANSQHVAHSSIIAKDGVRSQRQARDANELVPLHQVKQLIADVGGGGGSTTSAATYPFTALTLVNGNNNNIVLTGGVAYRITGPSAPFTITGLHVDTDTGAPSPEGSYIILFNNTGQNMTVAHNSSTAGNLSNVYNRINTVSGSAGIATTGSSVVTLIYDTSSAKWIVVSVVL